MQLCRREEWYQFRNGFPQLMGVNYDQESWWREQEGSRSPEIQRGLDNGAGYARKWTDQPAWRTATAEKIRSALGEKHYLRTRRRRTRRMCKELAFEAEALLQSKKYAEEALASFIDHRLKRLTLPPPLRRIVASKLAEKMIGAVGGAHVDAIVKALRCYGIFLCAVDDSVSLSDCCCLRPLVKAETTSVVHEKIKEVLQDGLRGLAAEDDRAA